MFLFKWFQSWPLLGLLWKRCASNAIGFPSPIILLSGWKAGWRVNMSPWKGEPKKKTWVFRQTVFEVEGGRFSWGKVCVFWRNDVMYSTWTLQREWRCWDPIGKMFYYTYMFSLKKNVCETYTTTKTSRNQYDWKGGFPILSKRKVARCGSVDGSDIW